MFGFACMYIPPTGDRKDFVFTKLAASKLDLMSDADAEDRKRTDTIQSSDQSIRWFV